MLLKHSSAHVPRLTATTCQVALITWARLVSRQARLVSRQLPHIDASAVSPECCVGARLLGRDVSTQAALAKRTRQSLTACSPPDLHSNIYPCSLYCARWSFATASALL